MRIYRKVQGFVVTILRSFDEHKIASSKDQEQTKLISNIQQLLLHPRMSAFDEHEDRVSLTELLMSPTCARPLQPL